ncbi:MJ0042-type zinc finger domain-containing protein [Methylopila sp. M107]|uniref:MJ0042-type zinc finger domain-containing protein n=1 Tax=Methylopila sp. M107 TaxID=1101190 RepID=UPI00037C292F|nr:MJ0042-type zinc finger domain-containing protein [Methylopila sp. M107]
MTISCPNCDASYRIDASALGAGRAVRCARCKTEWFARDPSEAPEIGPVTSLEPGMFDALEPIEGLDDDAIAIDAIDEAEPQPSTKSFAASRRPAPTRRWLPGFVRSEPKARPAPGRPKKKSAFRIRPAAALAAVGCVVLAALVGERVAVVQAAPSLASLYSRIGLPVNVRGLSIADVKSVERIEEGVPLLLVSGVVTNVSGDVILVPRLRLAITADRARELYVWTTVASRAKLAPGESTPFRARLASPPAEGQGLAVRFVGRTDHASRSSTRTEEF